MSSKLKGEYKSGESILDKSLVVKLRLEQSILNKVLEQKQTVINKQNMSGK